MLLFLTRISVFVCLGRTSTFHIDPIRSDPIQRKTNPVRLERVVKEQERWQQRVRLVKLRLVEFRETGTSLCVSRELIT